MLLTWQYYGLWQIEQGNRDQAQYHLSRIAAICGTDCEEYRSLAAALENRPAPVSSIEYSRNALSERVGRAKAMSEFGTFDIRTVLEYVRY